MFRVLVTFVLTIGVLGFTRGSAAQEIDQPVCDRLPPNIQIQGMFRPMVESLLEQSTTLLRQCRLIGTTRHIRVIIQMRSPQGGLARARATITRHEAGFLVAVIQLPIARDLPELLAHEFEHVIEQIERVDLAAIARGDSSLAHRDAEGVYETRRATRAGLAAADEIEIHQARLALARREAGGSVSAKGAAPKAARKGP